MSSNKREKIMSECPEGFEDALKEFIDDIESTLSDIRDKMEIDKIDEIQNFYEAYCMLDVITTELYE
jgi:hypothetical protein